MSDPKRTKTVEKPTGAAAQMGFGWRAGNLANALIAAAERRPEIIGMSADLKKYTDMAAFAHRFPERYVDVGMAEQSLVMVAAGLAREGLVPVASTFAAFLTRRAQDFMFMQIALARANAKFIGGVPGIASSFGPSHASVDDIAIMRGTPDIVILDPRDTIELGAAMTAALDYDGPVYLRAPFDRGEQGEAPPFKIGPALSLREGSDVGLVAAGLMVDETLAAAEILAGQGISAAVLATPTLRPFDEAGLLGLADRVDVLVTAENHGLTGGLFSIVSEVLARHGAAKPVEPVGIAGFPDFGDMNYLRTVLHLTAQDVAEAAVRVLKRRKK